MIADNAIWEIEPEEFSRADGTSVTKWCLINQQDPIQQIGGFDSEEQAKDFLRKHSKNINFLGKYKSSI